MARRTMLQRVTALLYPERCACCWKPVPCGALICEGCRAALPLIRGPVCPLCGRGLSACSCGGKSRPLTRCVSPLYYDGPARQAVRNLKFHDRPAAAELLYTLMADAVRERYAGVAFDGVVPVPLGAQAAAERQYNQCALLARGLAREQGIPFVEVLVKPRDTVPQRGLPAYRRSGNVLGAFDLASGAQVRDQTLLLVDDIVTTGATLDECAKMLQLYGARAVYGATAAAARLSKEDK